MGFLYKRWIVFSILLLAGCGGGDNGEQPDRTRTDAVAFVVQWGPINRATASSASQSAILKLKQAAVDGSDVQFVVRRDLSATDAVTQTYSVPAPVRVGTTDVSILFFAAPDASGTPLAGVKARVPVTDAGTTISVTTVQNPTSITILPDQTVYIGTPQGLEVTAQTASGALVPLAPGDIAYEVKTGNNNLIVIEQQLLGVVSGTATVTATAGGVTSPAETVNISSGIHVSLTPEVAILSISATQTFQAAVTGNANKAVVWSIQEGTAGGSITTNGVYTAPGQPGTYHITATSLADGSQSAHATVIVKAGSGTVTVE